ncbi:hypothetical protein [Planomonospora parontospora]|uniref:hypothetical protein n=1 Tax=Planomonospora parontospora TaxID=58119 RepID=UPI0016701146
MTLNRQPGAQIRPTVVGRVLDGMLLGIGRLADDAPYSSGKHHRHGVNVRIVLLLEQVRVAPALGGRLAPVDVSRVTFTWR